MSDGSTSVDDMAPRARTSRILLITGAAVFTVLALVYFIAWSLEALDTTPVIEVWLGLVVLTMPLVLVLWPKRWGRGDPKWMLAVTALVSVLLVLIAFPVRSTFRTDKRRELRAVVDLAVGDSATFAATGKVEEQVEPRFEGLGDRVSSDDWEVCRDYSVHDVSLRQAMEEAAERLSQAGFVETSESDDEQVSLARPPSYPEMAVTITPAGLENDPSTLHICASTDSRTVGEDCARAQQADTNLAEADLHTCELAGTDLSGADLKSADLSGSDLQGANLSNADLAGAQAVANFAEADLTGADLTSAVLTGADLTRANLTDANLTNADLTTADLNTANLTRANLTRADLWNADLREANFAGAILVKTRFLRTTCPDGSSSDDHQDTCVGYGI